MENHHFKWENSLYMAIFNSYVNVYQRVDVVIKTFILYRFIYIVLGYSSHDYRMV